MISPVTPDIFPQNGAHLADERLEIVVSRSGERPNLSSLRSQLVLVSFISEEDEVVLQNAFYKHTHIQGVSSSVATFLHVNVPFKLTLDFPSAWKIKRCDRNILEQD